MAATYTYAQLEGLWINAGGSPSLAPLMAAIAEAESGGNPTATNATDNNGTQTSWGLWQISNGTHNQPVPNILSPTVNAQQAVAKYEANGLTPWGTYDSGAYKKYMQNSTTPDTSGGIPLGQDATSASASAGSGNTSPGTDCAITLPNISFGIGSVGGECMVTYATERAIISGLLLGVAGIITLAGLVILAAAALGSTPAGRLAESVTPVGRVVSAVTPRRKAPAG
jgi:Lysozyme like domain